MNKEIRKTLEDPDERGLCIICGESGSGKGTDGKIYCSPNCARKNKAEPDIIDDEDAQSLDDIEIPQYAEPDDDNESLVEAEKTTEEKRGFY